MTTPGDNASFRVHLQSLLDFAAELHDQIEAVNRPIDRLSVLCGEQLPFGEFEEAHTLRARHQYVAQQMRDLVASVHEVMAFAADVTETIAEGYARYDQDIAGAFGGHAGPQVSPTDPVPLGAPPQAQPSVQPQYEHADPVPIVDPVLRDPTPVLPGPPPVHDPVTVNVVIHTSTDPLAATVRPPIVGGLPPVIPDAGGS